MYNLYDAVNIANKLGIKFDKFTPQEFLTGINISLIDKGMPSPYNKFINKKMYALPQYFKEKGFATNAIHPGNRWFYNRLSVYKYLGFDKSTFLEDLPYVTEKINYYRRL